MIDGLTARVLIKRSLPWRMISRGKRKLLWELKRPFGNRFLSMSLIEAEKKVSEVCQRPKAVQPPARTDYDNPSADLSVIIPVYNVEAYVKQCLDSVLEQKTSYRVEVIVINDGSTDSSGDILKEYEGRPGVILLRKENGGLSSARNAGLFCASGRYLLFLDSDDYMVDGSIELAMEKAVKEECDIVQMQYRQLAGKLLLPSEERLLPRVTEKYEDMCRIPGYVWMKVFKSSLFSGIIFPEGYWFEDTIVHMLLFSRCRKMGVIGQTGYVYRYNGQGITYSIKKSTRCLESLWTMVHVMEMRRALGMDMNPAVYREAMVHLADILYQRIRGVDEEIRQAVFVMSCGLVQEWKKELAGEEPGLKGRMAALERAFLEKNYGIWELYCRSV